MPLLKNDHNLGYYQQRLQCARIIALKLHITINWMLTKSNDVRWCWYREYAMIMNFIDDTFILYDRWWHQWNKNSVCYNKRRYALDCWGLLIINLLLEELIRLSVLLPALERAKVSAPDTNWLESNQILD